jgi:hypothetical protein
MDNNIPSEVAVVGITYQPKWYAGPLKSIKHTDKIRGDLILYSSKFAAGVGHKVVLVDGGSAKTFVSELKKIPGVKLFQSKVPKRSPNRRKAIFEASNIEGIKAIVMTEIEKVSLITDCMSLITGPILRGEADVVIPKREEGLFKKSYPDYMFESEVEGNLMYNEALRANGLLSSHQDDLDVFFGARVFKNEPKMLKYLLSKYEAHPFDSLIEHKLFNLEEYSNAQFFPVVKALAKGFKVVSVTVPFVYPEKQKENEQVGEKELFLLKRRYQRLTIIIELMHFLGYLAHKNERIITLKN